MATAKAKKPKRKKPAAKMQVVQIGEMPESDKKLAETIAKLRSIELPDLDMDDTEKLRDQMYEWGPRLLAQMLIVAKVAMESLLIRRSG